MTIESSTILLNHPWSSSNRSITYDISFPRLSSKIYRISCHELATRYISLSSPHLLSINHKKGKEERKKYSWNQRVRGKARNNSIYVESTLSLIEGKVRTQKFTQSTKSTVRQGSTQRLIPLREEPLLLNGGACFLSRRSLPRHRSRDVDSSIPKRPPPLPLLRNYHCLLQLPRQTRPGSTLLSSNFSHLPLLPILRDTSR